MSTEILVFHVGQGGIQLGNAMWELLCIEHALSPDGETLAATDEIVMKTFFQETQAGNYNPRVMFIDSEPSVTDEIRSGVYRQLYHPDQLFSGNEDAANNFARGSFVSGPALLKPFRHRLHKLTEQADNLECFLLFNSIGGGTGSGVGSLLLEQVILDFPKVTRMQIPIFCGQFMTTAIVEPYNAILHTHTTMDAVDLSILFDNEALYELCQKFLFIGTPNYVDVNRMIALMVSSITCSLRYEAVSHTTLKEIRTNLVPYPRIHFPLVRHAPIEHKSRAAYSNPTIEQITKNVFSKNYQSIKCDTNRGRYISIILNYRGSVNPREIAESVQKHRETISNFVEWCPTGFKVGINRHGPIVVPESCVANSDKGVTMICNTTAIRELWSRIGRKFDLLFMKRAFAHWFVTEGMEESEFGESRVDNQLLVEDYAEIGLNEAEIEERMENNPGAEDMMQHRLSHDAGYEIN